MIFKEDDEGGRTDVLRVRQRWANLFTRFAFKLNYFAKNKPVRQILNLKSPK